MDIWTGVKKVLSKGAPILANAIVPGAGGLAASLIAGALGCDNDPKAIEQQLKAATPEQWARLQEITMQHQERLVELATENDKLYLADRQGARQREIEITRATGKRDINLYILAWTVVVGYFILVGMMMGINLPDKNIGPINQLFGALAAGFGMVLAYFFGSSKSSADKTRLLSAGKQ